MSAKLISIIGPPASGKTTAARLLAEVLDAKLVLEDFEGNPFLAESYVGNDEACLPAQLYYLMSRVSQLSLLAWPGEGVVVSDYGLCQDHLYARAKLNAGDLALYEQVAARLTPLVKPPDVVVHVDCSPRLMRRRIEGRGRDFERVFTEDFLREMRDAHREAVGGLSCEVVSVDGDCYDWRRMCPVGPPTDQIVAALSV